MDVHTKEPEQAVDTETASMDVEPEAEEVPAKDPGIDEQEPPPASDDASGAIPEAEGASEPPAEETAAGEQAVHPDEEPLREPEEATEVRRAEFQPLSGGESSAGADNLRILMDVVVPITIELGAANLPLRKILDLGPGSVVRLDRALGEPADILVNGERVGRGEIVVVDDQFGVRVTELINPTGGFTT